MNDPGKPADRPDLAAPPPGYGTARRRTRRANDPVQKDEGQWRLRGAAHAANVGLWEWDLRTNAVFFSLEWKRQLGYEDHEVGNAFSEWESRVHPDDLGTALGTVRAYLSKPWPDYRLECRLRHKDGSYRWVLAQASLVRDDTGTPVRMLGVHVDITERKEAEALLDGQKRVLEMIAGGVPLETTLDALIKLIEIQLPDVLGSVLLLDPDGVHLRHGAAPGLPASYVAAIDGIAIGEGVGSCGTAAFRREPVIVEDIALDPLWADYRGLALPLGLRACWSTPILDAHARVLGTFALYFRTPRRPSSRHLRLIEIVTNVAAIAIARQRELETLRASEARLSAAQALAKLGSWELELAARTGTWSAEMFRLFGCDPAQGAPSLAAFLDLLHPDDRARVRAAHARVVETGEPLTLEFRTDPARGPMRHFSATATAVATPEGRVARMAGTVLDVTERKRMEQELRQREAQYLQAQKLEGVGRLAAGVAHDFNNLLTAISGYAELLTDRLTPGSAEAEDVGEIRAAADRAAALTRQLLAFSRQQVREPKVLDLNAVVGDLAQMLRRLLGEDVDLVTVQRQGLGAVLADPGQLEQVIVNLAVNARDAMPGGGKLTIEAANVDLDDGVSAGHAAIKPGRYVMLAVTDTGIGMAPEVLARLFEPFFTTKGVGKGTGLGLATVYGIVKQSDGYVLVDSLPGRGSTFRVYLPRIEGSPDAAPAPQADTRPVRGSETILLVEDEPAVRQVTRVALGQFGYAVLDAAGPLEALQLARLHRGEIHLLLTDVIMPDMTGRELADRLLAERAGVRVLYVSGYPGDAIAHRGALAPGTAFLPKPFAVKELARKVREVLDERGSPAGTETRLS
jgi:PAS domain S-box-containing protein